MSKLPDPKSVTLWLFPIKSSNQRPQIGQAVSTWGKTTTFGDFLEPHQMTTWKADDRARQKPQPFLAADSRLRMKNWGHKKK
jgi:hypothetical protein